MPEEKQLAKITIRVPKECTKTALSVDALDKHTSDLAWRTFIYIGEPQGITLRPGGSLRDISPTMLACLGLAFLGCGGRDIAQLLSPV